MPSITAERPHLTGDADNAHFDEFPHEPQLITAGSGIVPPEHRITAIASHEPPRHEALGVDMHPSEHRQAEAIIRNSFETDFGRAIEAEYK